MIDCKVQIGFPPELQKPVEDVVDAFLYLGPRDLRLLEQIPADIALDTEYMTELQRREALTAMPGNPPPMSLEELRAEILQMAQQPIREPPPPPPDVKAIEAQCSARQQGSAPR